MSAPLDQVLFRIEEATGYRPRKNGTGWQAKCPTHEDRNPSLSVRETSDGNVLLKCFAGCPSESIVSALNLEMKDLFSSPLPSVSRFSEWSNGNRNIRRSPHGEEPKHLRDDIEKVIVDCCRTLRESESLQRLLLDTRGLTLDTARRYGLGYDREKSRWSIPIRDPEGRTVGLKYHRVREDQAPKVLSEPGSQVHLFGYHLIANEHAAVVITEGEFDACVVYQSTRVNAVSGSGGAGNVKEHWADLLAGHGVHLFLDNDHAGRSNLPKWEKRFGPLVKDGRIPSLHVVSVFPEGCKDATDVLHKHGADMVKHVIEAAIPWIPKAEPSPNEDKPVPVSLCTDLANSERFARQHGSNVRYCYTQNSWLVWDGKVWVRDADGEVMSLAKQTVRSIYTEAGNAATKGERYELSKHARLSESRRAITDMLGLSQSERGIPIQQEQLDVEQWLFPLQNGVYDLKEDQFREHRREDYFTRIAPVSFDGEAVCLKFLGFLNKVMEGRTEVIAFLQRLFGICLTGDVGCQRMFILWGGGQNGKSTLIETILGVLGPFATKIDTEILLSKKYSQHPTGMTDLYGTRLAWTAESGDGRRLAEDLVKSITGGDRIRARRMRENFFEWSPTHKLLLLTNKKPSIRGRDYGIWRRICLVPFTYQVPVEERIDHYEKVLLDERCGIFNWMLDGLRAYQEIGLAEPDEVKTAVEEYKRDEDVLGPWLEDRCLLGMNEKGEIYSETAADLWKSYEEHCQMNAVDPVAKPTFWKLLTEHGIETERTMNSRLRRGIGLKTQ